VFDPRFTVGTQVPAVGFQVREERRQLDAVGGIAERVFQLFGDGIGQIARGVTQQWRTVRVGVPDTKYEKPADRKIPTHRPPWTGKRCIVGAAPCGANPTPCTS